MERRAEKKAKIAGQALGRASQARVQKHQCDKACREKAAAKWAGRLERREAPPSDEVSVRVVDEATVLAEFAELHQRFDARAIAFDDFSTAKDELMDASMCDDEELLSLLRVVREADEACGDERTASCSSTLVRCCSCGG
jgi:hypothetical protein